MVDQPLIRSRDNDRCVRCGTADSLHVHHRRLRSQGGADTWANQITLCTRCHNWAHHNVRLAHDDGLILWAGESPEDTRVKHWSWPHAPIWLNNDSTVSLWRDDEAGTEDGGGHLAW